MEWIQIILPFLISIVAGVAGWLGGMKLRRSANTNALLQSIKMLEEAYKKSLEDHQATRDENVRLYDENAFLRASLNEKEQELKELHSKIEQLQREINKLRTGQKELKNRLRRDA